MTKLLFPMLILQKSQEKSSQIDAIIDVRLLKQVNINKLLVALLISTVIIAATTSIHFEA